MAELKSVVKTVTINGEEKQVKITEPTAQDQREAQKVRNQYFRRYVNEGTILSPEIDT